MADILLERSFYPEIEVNGLAPFQPDVAHLEIGEVPPLGMKFLRKSSHGARHFEGWLPRGGNFEHIGDDIITYGYEDPDEHEGGPYVFATGYTGTRETMKRSACVAVRKFSPAAAIGPTGLAEVAVIDQYAEDIVAVANRIKARHLVGLSMGGAAVLLAAGRCKSVRTVTAVAPACMVDSLLLQAADTAKNIVPESLSLVSFALHHPRSVISSALPMGRELRHRHRTMRQEARELLTRRIHEEVAELVKDPNKEVRIGVLEDDGIVSPRSLQQVADRLGVNTVVFPHATHAQMVFDSSISERIVAMNRDFE